MSGGMGDEIIGLPNGFSSWNILDKMAFEHQIEESIRLKREAKIAEEATLRTVEIEGEHDD